MSIRSKIDSIAEEMANSVKQYWCQERNVAEEITEDVLDILIRHGIITTEIKDAYLEHF